MFRRVVLPAPVPPETMMFIRAFTIASKVSAISPVRVPLERRFSIRNGCTPNRRIETPARRWPAGG